MVQGMAAAQVGTRDTRRWRAVANGGVLRRLREWRLPTCGITWGLDLGGKELVIRLDGY